MSTRYVFLDIETTGLDPRLHQILEVGMIWMPFGLRFEFSLSIDEERADAKALEVNGYGTRELPVELEPEDAANIFGLVLDKAVVVGNNPQFDLRFIEQFLIDAGLTATPWNYHPIDIKALVGGRWRTRLGAPPWSTREIAAAVDVPLPEDAHTAMADAKWNLAVFRRLYPEQTKDWKPCLSAPSS